ncbi:MAG: UMP kinase [Candidatus Pacearchaeota archaeon]
MKKVVVISLGGSLIIPDEVDVPLLQEFKRVLEKHKKDYKFVIVCGGGSVARKYINALRKVGISEFLQSNIGISVTRLNARFMTYFFGKDANKGIPHNIKQVINMLRKDDIVFCGALRYAPNQTSDSVAAKISNHLKAVFINLTNVPGLYTKNPKEFKDARFIPEISWRDFFKRANAIKYKPGQHFVLDQTAAKTIMNNKITTYILGHDLKNLDNLLSNKPFKGTKIEG